METLIVLLPSVALLMAACLASLAFMPRSPEWTRGFPNAVICTTLCLVALVLALFAPATGVWERFVVAIAVLACATLAGWVVTECMLRLAFRMPRLAAVRGLPATGWVGLVERFGFTLALILGLTEVAALLIGVKALGAYASSKKDENRSAAARVLGTLTSITWALLSTAVYVIVTRAATT